MLPDRQFVRHTLATLGYRAGKALRDAPPAFAGHRIGAASRTPLEILAHMGDLFDWALSMVKGEEAWENSAPLAWDAERARFFAALDKFDAYLATDAPLALGPEQLFQGPIADALTHTGQLTMLRRLAGSPVKGENYARADIRAGKVGT